MKTLSFTFLEPGDKVLIVHRRLFPDDGPRYFLGTVEAFNENNGLLKVDGQSIGPGPKGEMAKKPQRTVKILSLTSGMLWVYLLDAAVNLERAMVETDSAGNASLVDGSRRVIDLNERIPAK